MLIRSRMLTAVSIMAVFIVAYQLSYAFAGTETIERVVAIVNDDVILMSEFNEAYDNAIASRAVISKEELLNEMIDRVLILAKAKEFNFQNYSDTKVTDSSLIEKYLERRIKAFIHIPFEVVENYYIENESQYKGKSFYDVQDEIEALLVDEKLKIKISEHINELRDSAYIRVQLSIEDKPAE